MLTLQSETDVVLLGGGRARQPDSERFRLWELAGAAHFDTYGLFAAHFDRNGIAVEELAQHLAPTDEVLGMSAGAAVNSGPQQHYVLNAALTHLDRWVREGTPPPEAPRWRLRTRRPRNWCATTSVSSAAAYARPGSRHRAQSSPATLRAATASCSSSARPCPSTRRPSRGLPAGPDEHRSRFEAATAAAVSAGYLLAEDAGEIAALARYGRQPSGWKAD